MLRILIVYDDLDPILGSNATLCYQHLAQSVDLKTCQVVVLTGKDCLPEKVEEAITTFEQRPFIFIAYSHGERDKLISFEAPEGYVHSLNVYFLGASLFYTNSCYTALDLREFLLQMNCYAYIGYEDSVRLPCDEADDLIFIACENKGIVHFLTTNDTLETAFEVMQKHYEATYDELLKRDFLLASRLFSAKQALILDGDKNITKKTFMKD